ncbi:MAG: hypothetical protein GXZ08_05280 [Tissierellia bacterium]|nr:hypothetical protein [Tissierellia bacterium]
MKEKLKTGLLFGLSILTIFLAGKIWFVSPILSKKDDVSKEKLFEMRYIMEDIVSPREMVINFGIDEHTIVYDVNESGLWKSSLITIEDIFTKDKKDIKSFTEISNKEYAIMLNQESIILKFHDMIGTSTLLNSIGIKKANYLSDIIPVINKVYISTGDNDFIVLSDDVLYYAIQFTSLEKEALVKSIDDIKQTNIMNAKLYNRYYPMNEMYGVENTIFIPDIHNFNARKIYFENVMENLDEPYINNIVSRFLDKSIDSVRALTQEDGNRIYVYDNKTVSLNENGKINYSAPYLVDSKDLNFFKSISTAVDFVSEKIGFNKSIHLRSLDMIGENGNEGYRLGFGMLADGLLVDLDSEILSNYIEIDVYNGNVKNYVQLLRIIKETDVKFYNMENAMELTDIIVQNGELFKRLLAEKKLHDGSGLDNLVKTTLENISLAQIVYLDNNSVDEEPLELVWKIVIFGKQYYFNCFSAQKLLER